MGAQKDRQAEKGGPCWFSQSTPLENKFQNH